ncbi:hypothetical protein [Actinomadura madurae]|uniref:hypothetical protein n=1 Tax=Actinomadura madurae TaxID=1993 RepID=UPI0020D2170C|nr:hypothetical protein [Actinomadura madurae]MCQ0014089.1 hypothetical protein [Actinomadura madurae]
MVVHEAVPVRQPIAESWRRSRDAGIDAGVAAAPLVFDRDVLADARAAHPSNGTCRCWRPCCGRSPTRPST